MPNPQIRRTVAVHSPAVEVTGGTSRVSTQRSDASPPSPVYQNHAVSEPQAPAIVSPVHQPQVSVKKSVSAVSVETSHSEGPTSSVKISSKAPNSSAPDTNPTSNINTDAPSTGIVVNTNTSNTGSRAGLEGVKASATLNNNKSLANSANNVIVAHSVTSAPYNLFNAITSTPLEQFKATTGLVSDAKNITEEISKNSSPNTLKPISSGNIQKIPSNKIVRLGGQGVNIGSKNSNVFEVTPSKINVASNTILPVLKVASSASKTATGPITVAQGIGNIQENKPVDGALQVVGGTAKTVEGGSELYQLAKPASKTAGTIANTTKIVGSGVSAVISAKDTYDGFSQAFDTTASDEQRASATIQGSVGAANTILNGAELIGAATGSFGAAAVGGAGAIPIAVNHVLLNHINNTISDNPNSQRAKIYLNSFAHPQNFG
ncbi:hypothetical protein Bsp3421_005571 [Burkholderia sp. FERM BP-3421]|uniref:hypothetical protein n=1 Tax=Burkholderia sp. FERM BP-3421 TaxID=1494466 RepID=UPI00235F7AC0|nr:hypothetical protein [Burkholderia sp. FERM BP-3421]WDD95397.1 hypothetical protein Bsp3421_005571 [Burkholderia sp. FERM BP-3421]